MLDPSYYIDAIGDTIHESPNKSRPAKSLKSTIPPEPPRPEWVQYELEKLYDYWRNAR